MHSHPFEMGSMLLSQYGNCGLSNFECFRDDQPEIHFSLDDLSPRTAERAEMASMGARLKKADGYLRHASRLYPMQATLSRRYFVASSCGRIHQSPINYRSTEVAADKYQRTTITEDVRRSATRDGWGDPRATAGNDAETTDASMIDPTIRHFTVNFVFLSVHTVLTIALGSTASSCPWCASAHSRIGW